MNSTELPSKSMYELFGSPVVPYAFVSRHLITYLFPSAGTPATAIATARVIVRTALFSVVPSFRSFPTADRNMTLSWATFAAACTNAVVATRVLESVRTWVTVVRAPEKSLSPVMVASPSTET